MQDDNSKIKYIDEVEIKNKCVLLRVDFDVALNSDFTIDDDFRIRQNLPTIKYLLENKNKLVCVAKLDRPKERSPQYSLKVVVERLQEYFPNYSINLIDDFLTVNKEIFDQQKENEILVLENIRFYPEEKANGPEFIKKLASLAGIYVNDAFAMCHRIESSITGVPKLIPSYGGLLLKKEVEILSKVMQSPQRPFIAIIGGIKLETKLAVVNKFLSIADFVLVGSGMVRSDLKHEKIIVPSDVVLEGGGIKKTTELTNEDNVLDIGPETQQNFTSIISNARTIVWNGPLGYYEDENFRKGTDAVYQAIVNNQDAVTIVGGGNTLAAISKRDNLDKITHVSTGGGAMLEFIEKGTLPGIEALKQ